jgi:hypothetical protein
MITVLLWLHLAGLVHLATLYGFTPGEHPSALLPVLPLLALAWKPRVRRPLLIALAGAGLAALLGFLLLARHHAWNGPDWLPAMALGLASLATVLAATGGEREDRGPWIWLWCAGWLLAGGFHPFLPLLGASLGALLAAAGLWRPDDSAVPGKPLRFPRAAAFLMAFVLSRPWWDFGMEPGWGPASAAFALGLALAAIPALRARLARLPESTGFAALALLGLLYCSPAAWAWGFPAGLAAGALWHRRPMDEKTWADAIAVFLGLGVAFALHANLWIPGLRQLLWWGA